MDYSKVIVKKHDCTHGYEVCEFIQDKQITIIAITGDSWGFHIFYYEDKKGAISWKGYRIFVGIYIFNQFNFC